MGLQVKKSIRALLVGAIMFAMVIGVFPAQQQQVKAASASDAVINQQSIRKFKVMAE